MSHLVDSLVIAGHLMPNVKRGSDRAAGVAGGRLHEEATEACASLDGRRGQAVEHNAPRQAQVLFAGALAMADCDFAQNILNPGLNARSEIPVLLGYRLIFGSGHQTGPIKEVM